MRVRTSANGRIIQEADYPSGWVPLIEALAHAHSAHEPAAPPELRTAPEVKIHEAISAVYDYAEAHNMKPPNVKQIAEPVKKRLDREGLTATATYIQKLAEDLSHKRRRRPAGPRVNRTLLPFSDPEM